MPDLNSLTSATGTTSPAGSTPSVASQDTLDKDAFLKLLVASLKYQNPDQPMDGQQYLAQMAQFSQVEQLTTLASSQAQLLSWQRAVAAEGMIGKTVSATASSGTVTGTVTGIKMTSDGADLLLTGGGEVAVTDVTSVSTAANASGSNSAAR
jgi:flagellar basal-body rod modification protein FlgD